MRFGGCTTVCNWIFCSVGKSFPLRNSRVQHQRRAHRRLILYNRQQATACGGDQIDPGTEHWTYCKLCEMWIDNHISTGKNSYNDHVMHSKKHLERKNSSTFSPQISQV